MTVRLFNTTTDDRQSGITLVELLVAMTILTVVTTMIIISWLALQSSYAQTTTANDSRSAARDALVRVSREIRTATAAPGSAAGTEVFTVAQPTEVDFYSSFNVTGQRADGTGTAALRLTKIYLSGTMPYQKLLLVKDSNKNGTVGDGTDQQIILASNVVNNSIPSTSSPTTAVFTYWYRDSNGILQPTPAVPNALHPEVTLASIVSVSVRLLVDTNLNHTPAAADLQTMVRPQNAPNN
jgi:type II secretory pathway pseudopilin PulG